jgi:DNA mismatch repair ATPase MutS
LLNEVYDIERIFYLINFKQNSPFHWLKLKISLNAIKKIQEIDNKYIQIPPELKKILEILDK